MFAQNRRAMRQRDWRRVVSITLYAKPLSPCRTLFRQKGSVAPDPARRLKILVSVVRFRPGPPRTYLAQRQSIVIGVVVSGLRRHRRLSKSTLLIHQYSTASSCVQAGSGQRNIVRERIIGLTSAQSDLHGLRIIASSCLYHASEPACSRRLRDSPQTPQRPIRCNPEQG